MYMTTILHKSLGLIPLHLEVKFGDICKQFAKTQWIKYSDMFLSQKDKNTNIQIQQDKPN